MSALRRWFRRWLFRQWWPHYRTPDSRPLDGQTVVILDEHHKTPVWLAEYNTMYNSYQAGGGWFEADEIVYWSPVQTPGSPFLFPTKDD